MKNLFVDSLGFDKFSQKNTNFYEKNLINNHFNFLITFCDKLNHQKTCENPNFIIGSKCKLKVGNKAFKA